MREDLKVEPVTAAAKDLAGQGHSRTNSRGSQLSHEILDTEEGGEVGTAPEGKRKRPPGDEGVQLVAIRADEKPKSKLKKLRH